MGRLTISFLLVFALATFLLPELCSAAPNTALDLASGDSPSVVADIRGAPLDGKFDSNNHVIGGVVGAGGPVWTSDNGRHEIGAGATYGRTHASFDGNRFRSPPNFGAGLNYRFRF